MKKHSRLRSLPRGAFLFTALSVLGLICFVYSIFSQSGQIGAPTPADTPLIVAVNVSPMSGPINTEVTFTAEVLGGTGEYRYLWNGAISGNQISI